MNNLTNIEYHGDCKFGLIYRATCSVNRKCYIGYTIKNLEDRKNRHFRDSKIEDHKFARAIRKYGWQCFEWEILYNRVPMCLLEKMERWTIANYDSYENGYNSTCGGEGILGFKHSEKTKDLLRQRFTGRKHTKESLIKMSISQRKLNKRYGEETKRKIGMASLGRLSPRFSGKKHSDETKRTISLMGKGRKHRPESRDKISKSLLGRKFRKYSSSKYIGVSWQKDIKKWRAKLGSKYLGVFKTELEAALKYNAVVLEKFGINARFNRINENES